MRTIEKLPGGKQIAYSIGHLGLSILINMVNLQLVYFYIPPEGSGLDLFIPQAVFLVVLNTLTLLVASGRLFDAITDPWIAHLSDGWKGRQGRRIPFLKVGALPAALLCILLFVPVSQEAGWVNIVWLLVIQLLFYLFLTVYAIPYLALLPELGHTTLDRLNLSTWLSITYALGIIMAAQVPIFADIFAGVLHLTDAVRALQFAIAFVACLAIIFMWVPAVFIDESRYCESIPTAMPLFDSLKRTFRNKNFAYYAVAELAFFIGLSIMTTGFLYYITVLLQLEETMMSVLMPVMIVISFLFYPAVNLVARKKGKKGLIVASFLLMSVVFLMIYFMGNVPLGNLTQAYLITVSFAVPLAFVAILPIAVLADIAEHDRLKTGIKQEGMYFAARTLMQKFGQTLGIVLFAMATSFGKDVGDDLGIRLSGIMGFLLCACAALYFMKYNERELLADIERMQRERGVEVR